MWNGKIVKFSNENMTKWKMKKKKKYSNTKRSGKMAETCFINYTFNFTNGNGMKFKWILSTLLLANVDYSHLILVLFILSSFNLRRSRFMWKKRPSLTVHSIQFVFALIIARCFYLSFSFSLLGIFHSVPVIHFHLLLFSPVVAIHSQIQLCICCLRNVFDFRYSFIFSFTFFFSLCASSDQIKVSAFWRREERYD